MWKIITSSHDFNDKPNGGVTRYLCAAITGFFLVATVCVFVARNCRSSRGGEGRHWIGFSSVPESGWLHALWQTISYWKIKYSTRRNAIYSQYSTVATDRTSTIGPPIFEEKHDHGRLIALDPRFLVSMLKTITPLDRPECDLLRIMPNQVNKKDDTSSKTPSLSSVPAAEQNSCVVSWICLTSSFLYLVSSTVCG